jgi:hypothetical protein
MTEWERHRVLIAAAAAAVLGSRARIKEIWPVAEPEPEPSLWTRKGPPRTPVARIRIRLKPGRKVKLT